MIGGTAWRVGLTLALLVIVALAGLKLQASERVDTEGAVAARISHYLAAADQPEVKFSVLGLAWYDGDPAVAVETAHAADLARVEVWAGELYTFYLASSDATGGEGEWAIVDLYRHDATSLARAWK
ncbi:MAG: hypothetical protein PVG11_00710 [Anaerolineae bacterium]